MTGPPNEESRPLHGTQGPGFHSNNQETNLHHQDPVTQDPSDCGRGRWDTPTLGAYRRRHGITDMCEEARVLLALEVVREAQRRVLLEVLDGIMRFLAAGATPDQAMVRVRKLVADYDARPPRETAA